MKDVSKYPKELLIHLYTTMLRIRLCEESLVEPILCNKIRCPVHLYSGEEAVAAGVCAALEAEDYIFGNHRSHGHFLAKGGSLNELIAEIFGKETGCSRGRGGSMHLINPDRGILGCAPIVAGTIPLAVGAALASKIRRQGRVSVSFFGDGATGEGVLYESLNFSALRKLPVIFVCENNLYSTHMPIRKCRTNEDIYEIAKPFDILSIQVDGNNVLEVFKAAMMAVQKCRNNEGPVFIECKTYRLRGHVGPDDNIQGTHTDIRPKEEYELWKKKDPIASFEQVLLSNYKFNRENIEEIRSRVTKELETAYQFTKHSPYPDEREMNKYVFKE